MSTPTSHHDDVTHDSTLPAEHWLQKGPWIGGGLAFIGFALTFALGMGNHKQVSFSYHVAFLFLVSVIVGMIFFVLFQFSTRAGWSVVIRRLAENFAAGAPLLAVLFLPMIFGMHTLYHHWTDLEAVQNDKMLMAKTPYLNETFFFIRAVIYLISWAAVAWIFSKKSSEQDKTGDHTITRKLQAWSYPSLAVMALTVTFAAFDWIMSLDPHWYSTIFGVYYFAGSILSSYAILIVMVHLTRGAGILGKVISVEHLHDLGKLTFGHTVFWTYIAFSQYFLMWYANIPEETLWFSHRMHGSWVYVSASLALLHFLVPFFFLMPRTIKRSRPLVTLGATLLVVMHYFDLYWLVMPTHSPEGFEPHFLDLTAIIGMVGVLLFVFSLYCKKRSLIPVKDPRLPESLHFENV